MAVGLRISGGRDGRWLLARLQRVLKLLGVRKGQWAISVVGDREMKLLHGRSLGLWTTTDVLTFNMRESANDGSRDTEGVDIELDTAVCWDEARRCAKELGHTVREELLLYCVHSLLHVQGYDDRVATGRRGGHAMHRREDELLVAVGVGTVYAGTAKRTGSGWRIPGKKRVLRSGRS